MGLYLVNMESGLEETALLVGADRRLDRVLHEAHLMPAHVVLDVDAQVLALKPGTQNETRSLSI